MNALTIGSILGTELKTEDGLEVLLCGEDVSLLSDDYDDGVNTILKVESAIKQLEDTESPEVVAHILRTENLVDDDFKTESALDKRTGIVNRLKDFAAKSKAVNKETFSLIGEIARTAKSLKKYDDIEKMVKDDNYAVKDKLSAKDMKAIGEYTAMFSALGYDTSKIADYTKFLDETQSYIKDIYTEFSDFMNSIWSTEDVSILTSASLGKLYKAGKLSAPKSVDFLKKLKLDIKKDRVLIAGLPVKLVHNVVSVVLVTFEENTGKLHVDTDVVTMKAKVSDQPLNKDELLTLVKAGGTIRAKHTPNHKKILSLAEKLNDEYVFSKEDTVVELATATTINLLISNIGTASKLRTNYFLITKNLIFLSRDVRLMIDTIITRTLVKK